MRSKASQPAPSLLRSKAYLLFWVSSLFSNIGTWMQQVAQPWVVLSISHSSLWVGLDSFAMNAPGWIFTLWGGVLADNNDRRKVILLFQSIQFLCIVVLVSLLALGWLKVWMIVLISFLVGLTDSLSMPAFQSIIPSLVKSEDIPRAVAFNSAQFNLSRILGPAVAGVVIARFGAIACFGANAVSYLPFFLSLYWIYPKGVFKAKPVDLNARSVSQIKEYKTFLLTREARTPLLTVLVTTLFCGSLITFCPVLIQDHFHSGVASYGGAMAAFGIGGLLGAGISLRPLTQVNRRDRYSIFTAIALCLTVIAVALNHSFYVLLALLVLAGATMTVSNVSANTSLQQTAGEHTRGRAASLFQLAIHGGLSLGALLTAGLVTQFGISNALILDGGIALAFQVWILCSQQPTQPSAAQSLKPS